MRIKVISDEHRFTIPIPNWMLFNAASAAVCTHLINRHLPENTLQFSASGVSYSDLRRFFKEVKKCRRYLQGEPLVYVNSSDGEHVEIYL